MDLHHCVVLQDFIDNRVGVSPVVHSGVADPASLVVGPQDLRPSTPPWRIAASPDWTATRSLVGENGAHLAVRARWQHRFVAEQQ